MADIDSLTDETEEKMMDAVDALERNFVGIRTGKASPALVEDLEVDYYGTQTRLKEIAGITVPEPRLIVVQPWDKGATAAIEKAIHASDIGITPLNDGRVLRLPIPELSEERRKDLVKQVHKRAEESKIELRNHRRDANDAAKKAQKAGDLTEDGLHEMLDQIQKLTDQYIGAIDTAAENKESELLKL